MQRAGRCRLQRHRPLRGQAAGRAGHPARLAHRHCGRCRQVRRQSRRAGRHRRGRRTWRAAASGSPTPSRWWHSARRRASRFPTHLLTSSALVGTLKPASSTLQDGDGVSVREALADAGGDADAYRGCARRKGDIAAYLELHIEQGPVLDDKGLRAGGRHCHRRRHPPDRHGARASPATPARCRWASRRDALAAAAEMIVAHRASRRLATPTSSPRSAACEARPGAPNVIPGRVEFTIDMRSPSDAVRRPRAAGAAGDCCATSPRAAASRWRPTSTRRYPRHRARRRASPRPCARPSPPAAWQVMRALLRRRPRCHDDGQAVPVRHDLPALQGRHQPQPRRVDHGGGRRRRRARCCWKRARAARSRRACAGTGS